MLLPPDVHLCVREPVIGVDMEGCERVGNRRSGDVRGRAACRLSGHRLRYGPAWNGLDGEHFSTCALAWFCLRWSGFLHLTFELRSPADGSPEGVEESTKCTCFRSCRLVHSDSYRARLN